MNFGIEKESGTLWKSPLMKSEEGFEFCIGVYANGRSETLGKAMDVVLLAVKGEKDEELQWPIKASFTLKLINVMGGEDKVVTEGVELKKATKNYQIITNFSGYPVTCLPTAFEAHSKLPSFINKDKLLFELLVVTQ